MLNLAATRIMQKEPLFPIQPFRLKWCRQQVLRIPQGIASYYIQRILRNKLRKMSLITWKTQQMNQNQSMVMAADRGAAGFQTKFEGRACIGELWRRLVEPSTLVKKFRIV